MKENSCPKCNMGFLEGAKFCQSCGYNLEKESTENPVCPTCQKTFPKGSKFCDTDGSKLIIPQKTISKCVVCGTAYASDVKFCPKDGGSITSVSEAPRLGYNQQRKSPPTYQRNNHNGQYIKASLGNRFVASLLDGLIMIGLAIPAIICYVLGFIEIDSYRGNEEDAIIFFLLAAFLYIIPLIYNFIKDGMGNGQSWGKKAVGLMVVYLPNNAPCSYGQSFVRALIMTLIGFVPFIGWLIEPIIVLASEDGRRLGDKAANTQVIEVKDYKN